MTFFWNLDSKRLKIERSYIARYINYDLRLWRHYLNFVTLSCFVCYIKSLDQVFYQYHFSFRSYKNFEYRDFSGKYELAKPVWSLINI